MIIRPLTIMAPRPTPPAPPGPIFDTVTIGSQVWLSCGTLEDLKLQVFNFTEARLVKV